jgi:hypothetical protein
VVSQSGWLRKQRFPMGARSRFSSPTSCAISIVVADQAARGSHTAQKSALIAQR